MRILLINPPRLFYGDSMIMRSTAPLGLAYIAGALKAEGNNVDILDTIAEAPYQISEFKYGLTQHGLTNEQVVNFINGYYDVIGISCMFTDNWLSNRELVDLIKEQFPNSKLMIGGEHASAASELCLLQCAGLDAIVIGEGEETVVSLVQAWQDSKPLCTIPGIHYREEDGSLIKTESKKRIKDLKEIPWPAWELFPLPKYFEHKFSYGIDYGKSLPVMATRGCPFVCTFCSSPFMWGTKYSMRSPEEMFNEIHYLFEHYGVTNFDFYDLTAIIKKDWIIAFASIIIESGIKITWQIPAGTRSEAIDGEVAKHLFLSGCKNITYAPESGSQRVLNDIKKKVTPDKMIQSIKSSYKEGLNVKLNIIVGFPDETHSDIIKTLLFMIRATWHGAHDAVPAIFSPYPGSALFERLKKEGIIDDETDEYLVNIVKGATYFSNPVYNLRVYKPMVRFYAIAGILLFYSFNYLFRPTRIFRTIRNLITSQHESRAEITMSEIIKRMTKYKRSSPYLNPDNH